MSSKTKGFAFFRNANCEYFPCHQDLEKEGLKEEDFNCLFCYCPLYALEDKCGGDFNYDNDYKIKDCSNCLLPHRRESYSYITEKCKLIYEITKK